MSAYRQALVLMAHADDETLGCGGSISKLAACGWDIRVVILSTGVVTTRDAVNQDNREHAMQACSVLGVTKPVFMRFEDQKFDTYPVAELCNEVLTLGIEPDLIFSHVGTDLNSDHRIVSEIAKIIGRPRVKPVTILGCEIPVTSFWNAQAFHGDLFVDISGTLDQKIEAFSQYVNEIKDPPNPWSEDGLRLLAQYHGMQAGLPAAEAFVIYRAYGEHLGEL